MITSILLAAIAAIGANAAPTPEPQFDLGSLLGGLGGGGGGGAASMLSGLLGGGGGGSSGGSLLSGLLGGGSSGGSSLLSGLGGLFGASDNPYQYRAGDALSDRYNPLTPLDEVPPFPSNFGINAIDLGPAPNSCAAHEIIFARGTSEPGPFGAIVGDPILARVKQQMGNQVQGYAAQYSATFASFAVQTINNDITNRITKMSRQCPNMDFAVVGYSLGGLMVEFSMQELAQNLHSKVKAVVLYSPFAGPLGRGVPSDLQSKTLQNCADLICLGGVNPLDHISYNTKGTKWHNASVKFIVSAFNGQPLPGNPGISWQQSWLRSIPPM